MRLGKTGIISDKNGFGALPIQRISEKEAVYLLQKALANGITFFDTSRVYTDSEEKMGKAFAGRRGEVAIATKSMAKTGEKFTEDLETSLRTLGCDYVDIMQFHNLETCPEPGDGSGLYEAAEKAKAEGKILHIGITNHRMAVAERAIETGLYETLQFPFSYLASQRDIDLVKKCEEADMGFIAMKAMSGGLIKNSAAAYAFTAQFENVLPIWGIQRESELDEFISYMKNPPAMTDEICSVIEADRTELAGEFCRSCGYCMPCPAGIQIFNCARTSLLLRRMPPEQWLSPQWQAEMEKINDCTGCGRCKTRCPYGLDIPNLLRKNYEDYRTFLK